MSVTAAANALVLTAAIAQSIDNIDVISLQNSGGEYLRKAPQATETISATSRKYTFYFDETEGNDTIVGMSLYGGTATTTLGTGTEMTEQITNIVKTSSKSLLIYWTVSIA